MLNELFVVIQITCINEFITALENLFLPINKKVRKLLIYSDATKRCLTSEWSETY